MQIKITGIGGVPFTNHLEAWEWALKFDLAFRPELPHIFKQESLLGQLSYWPKNPFPKIPENIGSKLKNKKVALHYPGPDVRMFIEQAMSLQDYCQMLFLRWGQDRAEVVGWQAQPILFLDMPNWSNWELQRPEEKIFWQHLKHANLGEWGIHCCGKIAVGNVAKAATKYLSFDYINALKSAPNVVSQFLNLSKDLTLIFGIIDSQGQGISFDQLTNLKMTFGQKGELWISPTCGLSRSSPEMITLIDNFLMNSKRTQ